MRFGNNRKRYNEIKAAAAALIQAKQLPNTNAGKKKAIENAMSGLNTKINQYITGAPASAAGTSPTPKGPVIRGPRRFGGIVRGKVLNNTNQALKINGSTLQNGNTNSIYRFKGNYYGKARNPDPGALVNGRRHGVFYRLNLVQNSPLTFKFSNAANLKGKEYTLQNDTIIPAPTAVQAENANLKSFINWYAKQAGLASNQNRAETFRTIRNRNLGDRPANGNAAQPQYNNNKALQNLFKTMTVNRNKNNSRKTFWAAVKQLNDNAAVAAEAAAAGNTNGVGGSSTGGR